MTRWIATPRPKLRKAVCVSGHFPLPGGSPLAEPSRLKDYYCLEGHQWRAEGEMEIFVAGEPEVTSGPLCPYCLVRFLGSSFEARRGLLEDYLKKKRSEKH